MFSFTTEVLCDETVTGRGNAKIVSADDTHCNTKIVVAHESGCPVGKIMSITKFMHDYPYVFGIILILFGPVVALYGRRFFPWVVGGIVSLCALLGILVFSSVVGLMSTTTNLIVSIVVALIVALLLGKLSMKTVWLAVGLLGLIGGFFIGSVIFTVFIATLGYGALWSMILFSVVCAVIFGFLSFRFSKQVVLLATSLIGSYAFMRGLTYFIGGYPQEAVIFDNLVKHQELEGFSELFWIYIAIFVCGFLASMYYQAFYTKEHEMLTSNAAYNKSDDEFKRVFNKKAKKTVK